jgi:hypothetical protein
MSNTDLAADGGWLTGQTLPGGIVVEKHEILRPGGAAYYPLTLIADGKPVIHTTEGYAIAAALNVFEAKHDGPHFLAGEGRAIQCRPLHVQAAALHAPDNQYTGLQIECVGFSQVKPWLFDYWISHALPVAGHTMLANGQLATETVTAAHFNGSTLKPLVSILAFAVMHMGVVLQRPPQWKDDCSDMPLPWAARNKRRQQGVWPNGKWVYGHIEATAEGPDWHWDPGALNYTALFVMVNALIASQGASVVSGQ